MCVCVCERERETVRGRNFEERRIRKILNKECVCERERKIQNNVIVDPLPIATCFVSASM